MASEHTRSAISEANSLAMQASLRQGSPRSLRWAALSTSWRAASMRVAMSASRKATAWCLKIGLPKASRS